MSHSMLAGGLAAHSPIRLQTIQDVTGFDFMKLVNLSVLLAGALTFLHYTSASVLKYFLDCFATTVRIDDDDPLYHHLLRWTMDHHPPNPRFCSLRAVSKGKISWADEEDALNSVKGTSKGTKTQQTASQFINYRSIVNQPPINLQPLQGTHLFRHDGRYILFRHCIMSENRYTQLMKERGYIQLQCLGTSVDVLQGLLQEAQSYHLDKTMTTTMTTVYRPICTSETVGLWTTFSTRPSRHISTVIFDAKKKDELLRDINEYLHPRTRRWYSDHGIPYRRGYLFSGAPGMGKTSLTSALAGLFGLNVYVLSLLDPNLNDSQLMKLMSDVPSRCIVLLEDVDAAGLGRRDLKDSPPTAMATTRSISQATGLVARDPFHVAQTSAASISLSGLLNAIDGVSSQEGRILIMTTNSPESLDPALIRPGRVDMHVDFQLPSRDQMRALFVSMYSDLAMDGSESDMASTESLKAMAETFAASIPERSVSLARLQGYLLQYKQSPKQACEHAAEWAKDNSAS